MCTVLVNTHLSGFKKTLTLFQCVLVTHQDLRVGQDFHTWSNWPSRTRVNPSLHMLTQFLSLQLERIRSGTRTPDKESENN